MRGAHPKVHSKPELPLWLLCPCTVVTVRVLALVCQWQLHPNTKGTGNRLCTGDHLAKCDNPYGNIVGIHTGLKQL